MDGELARLVDRRPGYCGWIKGLTTNDLLEDTSLKVQGFNLSRVLCCHLKIFQDQLDFYNVRIIKYPKQLTIIIQWFEE